MRLLRLSTEDQNGRFDNVYDTDIHVKKGSKIALQNASFSELINTLKVDGTNDEITFQIKNGSTVTANLEHADEYNNSNKQDLFDDITKKLNQGLSYAAGKAIGLSFLGELNDKNDRVNIGYKKCIHAATQNRVASGEGVFTSNVSFTSTTIRKGTASSVDDTEKYYSNLPWGRGPSTHRARITNYTDTGTGNNDNGFILGLSNVSPQNWKDKADMDADMTYFIEFVRGGTNYFFRTKGGARTDSGVAPAQVATGETAGGVNNNDFIEIRRDGERIKGFVFTSTTTHEVFDVADTYGEELYPFISIQGNFNHVRLQKSTHSVDAYQEISNTEDLEHATELGANPPPSLRGNTPTDNILTLPESVGNFLGYTNFIIEQSAARDCQFSGDNIFIATLSNVSFIIELRNISIDSYNSVSRQGSRQNILATIPMSANITNRIIEYEPNNLYFVNINQDVNVRNLKARILRIDGATPALSGLSILTILIKDSDE